MTFPAVLTGTPAIDWLLTLAALAAAARGFVRLARFGRGVAVAVGVIDAVALVVVIAVAAVADEIAVDDETAAAVALLLLTVPAVAGMAPRPRGVRGRGADAVTAAAALTAAAAVAVGLDVVHPVVGFVVAGLPAAIVTWGAVDPRPVPRSRAFVAAVVLVLLVGIGRTAQALLAGRELLDARDLARDGLDAATTGDLDGARAAVADASNRFATARDRLDDPSVRLLRLVPGLSQNVRAAERLAGTGTEVMASIDHVADLATAERLRPTEGRFPLAAFDDLHAAMVDARASLAEGARRLDAVTSEFLVFPVGDAVDALGRAIDQAADSLETSTDAVGLAPRLLGGSGGRRWFVAVLTPSERRGAGGLLGDFALLDVDGGAVDVTRSGPIGDLNGTSPTDLQTAALPPIYQEQYATWEAGRYWQNLTVTPDFPTVGQAITALSPVAGIGPVDGVVAIDPIALQGLLEITGPVEVAPWPEPITAQNVADLLLINQYREIPDLDVRAAFQADLIDEIVDRLTGTALDPATLVHALGPAIAGGHLRLYSAAPDEEAVFRSIGADGTLSAPAAGDYLSVVSQNGSQSKIDFFLRRAIRYDVDVDPATGVTTATVEVALTNEAPASGLDPVIIGGGEESRAASGEMRSFTTIFSALDVESVSIDGGPHEAVTVGAEGGLHTGTVLSRIAPGTTQVLTFQLSGQLSGGEGYRLFLDHQPAAHADDVVVEVLGERFAEELHEPWVITAG